MIAAVGDAIGNVLDWVGTVITSLTTSSTGELNALLPLFAIGIAISAILLGKLYAQGKILKFGETLSETIPSQA